jgi:geranylgeranyl pyrophosphate synthase
MAVTGPVTEVMRAGGSHIPDLLDRVERLLGQVAGSHGALLAEHAGATIAAGGKRLRPLLVFLAADTAEGDGLVRAAAAVELVHSATLVHDDVLDAATATGDLLFARAFAALSANGRADEIQVLSEASSALAEGELLQRADAWNAEVPLERYLHRCELKTARLFEAACRLGALEGDGGPEELGAFGRRIGLAFQLLDDVLDVSGPAERTGKQRGTDLLDGTVTLPFILARERDGELAALDPRSIDSAGVAEDVCDRIAATGALDDARARALEMVNEAKAGLPDGLSARQRHALELVATGVVARYA